MFQAIRSAITGFNPVGMLASAAVNALVGKYQTTQQNKAIDAANAQALERESTQFQRLRDSAVRAGFNPLTALRSGMFQQANLFAREADTFRGDLFGGLANAALAIPQARFDAEMRDLERREREMNIEYVGALASNTLDQMVRRGSSMSYDPSDPNNRREVTYAGQTNPFGIGADNQFTAPWMPDAEAYEQRYGDIAQEAGVFTIEADVAYNEGLRQISQQSGRSVSELDRIIRNSNNPLHNFNNMLSASGGVIWTRPSTWPNWLRF